MARASKGFLGRLLRGVLLLVLVFGLIGPVMVTTIYRFVPPPVTWLMIQRVFEGKGFDRRWRSLDDMSPKLVRAVIAAEDAKFCDHNGFDFDAMEKAFESNAKGRKLRGGSTISQQTAKNVFLWQGGGYFRKGLEAWFTFWIEMVWGKRRIMEVYLNVAETGIGTYGAEAGSQRYFGHSAARMSRDEASRMAAALPSPKKRSVKGPGGWLASHGNRIERRIGTVRRDGLDACVYN